MYEDFPENEGNILEESIRKDNREKDTINTKTITDYSNLNNKICTSDLAQVYYDEPTQKDKKSATKEDLHYEQYLRTETEEDLDISMNSINKPNK